MKLETAALVEGTETLVGDGASGATRCVLILADGSRKAAVLKRGSEAEITAECFCALLLRAWGLDVPDPYLVSLPEGLGFASADAGYPSLKHRLSIGSLPAGAARDAIEKVACELVAGFSSTPLALMADEAIENRDRNLGNILWDGSQETWIDHGASLGVRPDLGDVNKLAMMAIAAAKSEEIKKSAVARALIANPAPTAEAEVCVHTVGLPAGSAAFVAARVTGLAQRIIDRFPAPADLLSRA